MKKILLVGVLLSMNSWAEKLSSRSAEEMGLRSYVNYGKTPVFQLADGKLEREIFPVCKKGECVSDACEKKEVVADIKMLSYSQCLKISKLNPKTKEYELVFYEVTIMNNSNQGAKSDSAIILRIR